MNVRERGTFVSLLLVTGTVAMWCLSSLTGAQERPAAQESVSPAVSGTSITLPAKNDQKTTVSEPKVDDRLTTPTQPGPGDDPADACVP